MSFLGRERGTVPSIVWDRFWHLIFLSNVVPTLPNFFSDNFSSKHIFYPKWFMYMYLHNAFDVRILPRMPSECTILVLFSKKSSGGGPPDLLLWEGSTLPYLAHLCLPSIKFLDPALRYGQGNVKRDHN